MSTEILSVRQGTSIEEALKIMVNSRITGLPVVDASGKMIGVFSEYDVIKQINDHKKPSPEVFRKPIQFSKDVHSVSEKTPLSEIINKFVDSRFRRLPVLNSKGKLVGIITRRDLMKLFYYRVTLAE